MRRHELTDDQWILVKSLLPENGHRGGQWKDHRMILNGILWRVRTGVPWRDLPQRYGPWQTVYDRFNRWRKDGTWDRIAQGLQIRLDEEGMVDWDLWCVDGTNVRATQVAAGGGKRGSAEPPDHGLGRSRGGWGSKLHVVTDGRGLPLAVHVTAGQVHETTQFEGVITAVRVPEGVVAPHKVAGDKGYSAKRIREWLKQRAIEGVIPHRDDERRRDRQGHRCLTSKLIVAAVSSSAALDGSSNAERWRRGTTNSR